MAKNYGAPSDRLVSLLVFGLFAQAIGGALVALSATEDAPVWMWVGLALVAVGALPTLMGAVGWGVLLALRIRDEEIATVSR